MLDTYADMQMKPSIQMCQNNITTQDTRRTLQVQYIVLPLALGNIIKCKLQAGWHFLFFHLDLGGLTIMTEQCAWCAQ